MLHRWSFWGSATALAFVLATGAPTPSPAADPENFLDQFGGRTFLTDVNVVKVGITDQGEWRLTSPDGMVVYIARDTPGSYKYWMTSPLGLRSAATGAVSQRGVAVCLSGFCQYWLTAANGSHHYVATRKRKDGSVQLYLFAPLIAEDAPNAKSTRKLWESRSTNPSYLVYKDRKQLSDYIGFDPAKLDDWISGQAIVEAPRSADTPGYTTTTAQLPVPKATVFAAAGSRTTPTPSQITAEPTGPVDARRWGALAGMIGTVWKTPHEIYTIDWDRPGEAIRVGVDGLYGEEERLIVPAADGKSLRYVRSKPASGILEEASIAVERSKAFVAQASPAGRSVCVPTSKGATLTCTWRDAVRDKSPAQVSILARTEAAGGQALLASLPGRFPGRPAGAFDRQLGMLAEMADRRWTADPKPTANSSPELLEFGGNSQGRALIAQVRGQYSMPRVVFMQSDATGGLSGSFYAGSVDYPNAMGGVTLKLDDGGAANICTSAGCDHWRLSRDRQVALRIRVENGVSTLTTFRPIPDQPSSGVKLFDQLHGRTFLAPNGRTLEFRSWTNGIIVTTSWARGDRASTVCYSTADPNMAECSSASGVVRKGLPFVRNDGGFAVDGYAYAMRGLSVVRTSASDKSETVFAPSSHGQVELAVNAYEDRKDQNRLRRENCIQTAEKARRQREMFSAIMGAAQAIGTAMAGNPASSGYTPYTPSYRGGTGGAGQPGGYASSMGSISSGPFIPPDPAYLRQKDELERFAIREKLYGRGAAGTNAGETSRPYAKAQEQLERDRAATVAASQARRAEREAEEARQQQSAAVDTANALRQKAESDQRNAEIDARRRAAADAAAKASAARAASSKAASGGSSPGGIIVRDDRAEEAQRATEASRVAAENEARAAAERAKVAALRAQQDREAAASAKKREEDRIRALIKCHGSLEKAAKAKATCA